MPFYPDLHLIYNFTVYIVNNGASPYVEWSMKHFYFNHFVGKLERTKKVCFPLSMFCVSDHREEFTIKVGTRKGQIEKWMYHMRGQWNYLNVRVHLSSCYWVKLFESNFKNTFSIIVHVLRSLPTFVLKRQVDPWVEPVEVISHWNPRNPPVNRLNVTVWPSNL